MQLTVSWSRCLTPKGDTACEEWNVMRWADDVATFQGFVLIEYSAAWFRREGSILDIKAMTLNAAKAKFGEVTP